jgi:hypothetical protein
MNRASRGIITFMKSFVAADTRYGGGHPCSFGAKLLAIAGHQVASENQQNVSAAIPVICEKIDWLRLDTGCQLTANKKSPPPSMAWPQLQSRTKFISLDGLSEQMSKLLPPVMVDN